MKSLGFFKLKVPTTGFEIIGEKFSVHNRILFNVRGYLYEDGKLEVVGRVTDGSIPSPPSVPWNQ